MSVCMGAAAQEADKNAPLKTEKVKLDPTQRKKLKTGVLMIKGPEDPDDVDRIAREYREMDDFNKRFEEYDHRIIGSPESDLDLKEVSETIRKFGESCDNLLVFISVHGNRVEKKEKRSDIKKDSVITTFNSLQVLVPKKDVVDTVTSRGLFAVMAEAWNPNMRGVILNGSCYGSADPVAFMQMPPGTKTITLSDPNQYAYDLDAAFLIAMDNTICPVDTIDSKRWQNQVVGKLVYYGAALDHEGFDVPMRVFTSEDREPDGVKLGKAKIPAGIRGGYVTECNPKILTSLFAMSKLSAAAEKGNLYALSPVDVVRLIESYKESTETLRENKTKAGYRGWVNYIAFELAERDGGTRSTVAEFMAEHRLLTTDRKSSVRQPETTTPDPDAFLVRSGLGKFIKSFQNH